MSIVSARPGEAAPGSTIVYIHGLENKPPPDKKKEWCFEALAEGLKRNTGQTLHADFAVAYWADLRYERPDDTAAQPGRRAAAGPGFALCPCRRSRARLRLTLRRRSPQAAGRRWPRAWTAC